MERQYNVAKKIISADELFYIYQVKKFGDRYIEYRNQWERPFDFDQLLQFPLYIIIEISMNCNLECVSCFHGKYCVDIKEKWHQEYETKIMPHYILDAILEQAKQNSLPSIGLNWFGEPTMAKDIEERISKCSAAGIMDIIMSSNGMLIDQKKSEQIIKAGLTHMLFSVDAATEKIYNKIRIKGNYRQVNENILNFMDIRKKLTNGVRPKTRVSFVPSKLNQHEIDKFIEKYSNIVDYVEIQPFCNCFDRMPHLIPDNSRRYDFVCEEVFKKLVIDVNGDIHPCCSVYGRKFLLGNVLKDDLKEVFQNNKILNSIREDAINGKYRFTPCKQCQQTIYKAY